MLKIIMGTLMLFAFQSSLQAGTTPTLENTTKLYVATFNRAPDAAGLNYWLNNSGLDLEGIAQSFFDQPETKVAYPADSSNEYFVETVYQNLFNRASETAGLEYWVGALDSGYIKKSVFILAMMNGAQDTEEFGYDATILTNKTTVGLSFSNAGLNDVVSATAIMIGVSSDVSSVITALEEYGIALIISSNLDGTWKGTYTCKQGLTGVTLNIVKNISSDYITAIFSFYAVDSNPSVPSGSYNMIGVYQNDLALSLKSLSWINRPSGYVMVDLNGQFNSSFSNFTGSILSTTCSTFSLSKVIEKNKL